FGEHARRAIDGAEGKALGQRRWRGVGIAARARLLHRLPYREKSGSDGGPSVATFFAGDANNSHGGTPSLPACSPGSSSSRGVPRRPRSPAIVASERCPNHEKEDRQQGRPQACFSGPLNPLL